MQKACSYMQSFTVYVLLNIKINYYLSHYYYLIFSYKMPSLLSVLILRFSWLFITILFFSLLFDGVSLKPIKHVYHCFGSLVYQCVFLITFVILQVLKVFDFLKCLLKVNRIFLNLNLIYLLHIALLPHLYQRFL